MRINKSIEQINWANKKKFEPMDIILNGNRNKDMEQKRKRKKRKNEKNQNENNKRKIENE